jgi:Fe2+ or Zn2+ uptake regulation protein
MEIHKLEQKLKENDLRLTEARKLVFETFANSKKALSAMDIYKCIGSKTDLASIYRNITLFKDLGLIHSLNEGNYSLCQHEYEDDHSHKHIHIIVSCQHCGHTEEIKEHKHDICDASNAISKFSNPLTSVSSIVMNGCCAKCS